MIDVNDEGVHAVTLVIDLSATAPSGLVIAGTSLFSVDSDQDVHDASSTVSIDAKTDRLIRDSDEIRLVATPQPQPGRTSLFSYIEGAVNPLLPFEGKVFSLHRSRARNSLWVRVVGRLDSYESFVLLSSYLYLAFGPSHRYAGDESEAALISEAKALRDRNFRL